MFVSGSAHNSNNESYNNSSNNSNNSNITASTSDAFSTFVLQLLAPHPHKEAVLQQCQREGIFTVDALQQLDSPTLRTVGFGFGYVRKLRQLTQPHRSSPHSSLSAVTFRTFGAARVFANEVRTNAPTVSHAEGQSTQTFGTVVQSVGSDLERHLRANVDSVVKAFQERVCLAGAGAYLTLKYIAELPKAGKAVCGIHSRKGNRIFGTGFVIKHGDEHVVVTALHNVWKKLRALMQRQHREAGQDAWKRFEPDMSEMHVQLCKFVAKHTCVFDYDDVSQAGAEVEFRQDEHALVKVFFKLDVIVLRLKVSTVRDVEPLVPISRDDADRLIKADNRCAVVGHPVFSQGQSQQTHKLVSMQRENIFYQIEDPFVRYFTDTEEGNSGSPVLVWDEIKKCFFVAAVHHSGVRVDLKDNMHLGYNEGTLMTKIDL